MKITTPRTNRCTAMSKSGTQCQCSGWNGGKLCYLHANPELAALASAKGGRRRAIFDLSALGEIPLPKTANDVRDLLAKTICDTRAGRIDTKTASCIAYLSTSMISAIETATIEEELRKLLADAPEAASLPPLPAGAERIQ